MNKWYAAGLAAFVAVAFVVGNTLAQDMEEKKGEAGMGAMPAWMAKTDVHKKLAESVGTFDVETEFWMAPGAPAQKGKAVSKREMILNGFYLRETFKMDWEGMKFEGQLTSGYDTVRKRMVNTWVDNMSPVMNIEYGGEKDGMLVFTGENPGMDGTLKKTRSTIKFDGDDKWTMTAYFVKEGGDEMHMRMVYTRRKE
jgi:hypothetical protein